MTDVGRQAPGPGPGRGRSRCRPHPFPVPQTPPTAGAPPDVCGCSLVSASRRGALGRVRPSLSEKVPSLAIREEGVLPAGAAPRLLVFRAGSHRRVALRPSVGACSGREPPSFPLRCGEEGSAGPRGGGRAPALCLVAARASPLRVGGGSRRAGAGARCARVVGGVAACARACAALPRRWAGTPGGGGAWGPALRVTSPRPPRAFPSAPPPRPVAPRVRRRRRRACGRGSGAAWPPTPPGGSVPLGTAGPGAGGWRPRVAGRGGGCRSARWTPLPWSVRVAWVRPPPVGGWLGLRLGVPRGVGRRFLPPVRRHGRRGAAAPCGGWRWDPAWFSSWPDRARGPSPWALSGASRSTSLLAGGPRPACARRFSPAPRHR